MALTKATEWPGAINVAGNMQGSYSGCKLILLSTVQEVNTFFENNPNALLVKLEPFNGGIYVLYTKFLTDEELQDFDEFNAEVEHMMRERRAKRAEAKEAEVKKLQTIEEEKERLAVVGKRCIENHGHIIKEKRGGKRQTTKGD